MRRSTRIAVLPLALPLALALVPLAGCGSSGPEPMTFPPGFLFGTSVAGFQVDMGCPTLGAACDDPNSDWYVFVTDPGLVADPNTYQVGQPPSVGPGMWETYEQDFDRAQHELANNGLRLSIEWSRIFPTATDGVEGYEALGALADAGNVAHYHAVFQALRARGLEPLVTLNHYALPTWIHDTVGCHQDLANCSPRGWVDSERTVREIAKYAGFCAQEFGAEVDLWATLNEPFAVVFPGYLYPSAERANPPSVRLKSPEAKIVLRALIEAHARMYDAVKANDTVDASGDGVAAQVGVVYAMSPVAPKDPTNPLDVQAAENVFYLWNLVYLNGVVKGDVDENLDGTTVHVDSLANRMDYLGINYYSRPTVEGLEGPAIPKLSPLTTFNPLTIEPWSDYPRGIYDMIMMATGWGLPVIITETGAADPNDDGASSSWLVRYATWVARALRDGADVRGFFYWSLMDNYEWNHGMDIRMGLYAVDPDDPTKTRTARTGVATYAAFAATGTISVELQKQYPAPEAD